MYRKKESFEEYLLRMQNAVASARPSAKQYLGPAAAVYPKLHLLHAYANTEMSNLAAAFMVDYIRFGKIRRGDEI